MWKTISHFLLFTCNLIFCKKLNYSSVWNCRRFRHNNNSFTNKPTAVFVFGGFKIVLIDESDIAADAGVFVNNGAADNGIFADAEVRFAAADVLFYFLERFKNIRAHND